MVGNRVPIEVRPDIISVVDYIQPMMPFCPAKQQTYLFEVYNQYFKPLGNPDLEEGCGGCRSEVLNKIKFAIRLWKEQD